MPDAEMVALRRRLAEAEAEVARLRDTLAGAALDHAARIVDEVTGNDDGTNPFVPRCGRPACRW